jgi:hypothetical protein
MLWSVPHVSGVLPSGRSRHAWTTVNEKLYLFGGVSTEARAAVSLDDVFILTPFGTPLSHARYQSLEGAMARY